MKMKKEKLVFILICIIAVAGIFYVAYQGFSKKNETATVNLKPINGENDKTKLATTTQINKISVPNLSGPILFKDSVSTKTKEEITKKMKDLSEELGKDNDYFDGWIQLGLYRKNIGDYDGAQQAWEYAGLIRPENSLSFGNLGMLYGYYLKDNIMAEKSFIKATKNDKTLIYLYAQFASFYHEVLKNDTKAKAILEQGIAANPGPASQDLQNLLKNLK